MSIDIVRDSSRFLFHVGMQIESRPVDRGLSLMILGSLVSELEYDQRTARSYVVTHKEEDQHSLVGQMAV